MRLTSVIISIIISLTGCQKDAVISLTSTNHNKIIALQPLGDYKVERLERISSELSTFFNIRVITLKPIDIPQTFRSSYEEKYSADSLLLLLSKIKNDSIVEVVGVTRKKIYTYEKVEERRGDKSIELNKQIGVYGLGYLSGSSCVVSDAKFLTTDEALFNSLLRKAIIHEIGHNLGLEHCSVQTCLMAEADGDVSNLIKLNDDYCKKCRERLK